MMIGFVLVLFLVKEDKNTYGFRVRSAEEGKKSRWAIVTPYIISIMVCLLVQRMARTVFTPFLALYVQENLGTITGAARYTGFINGATSFATAAAALTITRWGDRTDKLRLSMKLTLLSIPVMVLTLPFKSLSCLPCSLPFSIFLREEWSLFSHRRRPSVLPPI